MGYFVFSTQKYMCRAARRHLFFLNALTLFTLTLFFIFSTPLRRNSWRNTSRTFCAYYDIVSWRYLKFVIIHQFFRWPNKNCNINKIWKNSYDFYKVKEFLYNEKLNFFLFSTIKFSSHFLIYLRHCYYGKVKGFK